MRRQSDDASSLKHVRDRSSGTGGPRLLEPLVGRNHTLTAAQSAEAIMVRNAPEHLQGLTQQLPPVSVRKAAPIYIRDSDGSPLDSTDSRQLPAIKVLQSPIEALPEMNPSQ